MASVLIVAAPGAEEIELITVADVLRRAEQDVTIASTSDSLTYIGSRDLPMAANTTLDAVIDQDFDLVYLPGGFGSAETCRDDARIQSLIKRQLASDRLLAIICAAPIALVPAACATDRRVTSYPAVSDTVRDGVSEWVDQKVVIDGNLITSQGPGTAMDLALTLAGLLAGENTAQSVAKDMLIQWPSS